MGLYFRFKLIEAVEGVLVGVHVERVNAEVVGGEFERLEHLLQGERLAVSVDDDVVGEALDLGLDEAEQMLLVHGSAVVDVRVDLAHVVEVTMGHALHVGKLAVLVEQEVKVPLALEVLESAPGEALDGTIRNDAEKVVEIFEVLADGRDREERLLPGVGVRGGQDGVVDALCRCRGQRTERHRERLRRDTGRACHRCSRAEPGAARALAGLAGGMGGVGAGRGRVDAPGFGFLRGFVHGGAVDLDRTLSDGRLRVAKGSVAILGGVTRTVLGIPILGIVLHVALETGAHILVPELETSLQAGVQGTELARKLRVDGDIGCAQMGVVGFVPRANGSMRGGAETCSRGCRLCGRGGEMGGVVIDGSVNGGGVWARTGRRREHRGRWLRHWEEVRECHRPRRRGLRWIFARPGGSRRRRPRNALQASWRRKWRCDGGPSSDRRIRGDASRLPPSSGRRLREWRGGVPAVFASCSKALRSLEAGDESRVDEDWSERARAIAERSASAPLGLRVPHMASRDSSGGGLQWGEGRGWLAATACADHKAQIRGSETAQWAVGLNKQRPKDGGRKRGARCSPGFYLLPDGSTWTIGQKDDFFERACRRAEDPRLSCALCKARTWPRRCFLGREKK
ncbi:hypothetical protein L1887_51932 [Cichorium endivia]|nr:hypothetical protein L1887_51932 [Cichorium endivia]